MSRQYSEREVQEMLDKMKEIIDWQQEVIDRKDEYIDELREWLDQERATRIGPEQLKPLLIAYSKIGRSEFSKAEKLHAAKFYIAARKNRNQDDAAAHACKLLAGEGFFEGKKSQRIARRTFERFIVELGIES